MTPPRAKSKPVFDPTALDDDLDDLWPGKPTPPRPHTVATTPRPAPTPPAVSAPAAPSPAAEAPQSSAAKPLPATPASRLRSVAAAASAGQVQTRYRPPEVLLSAEVYDALYQLQIAEKKSRRGLARPMGAIVLDAIERYADRLATTWDAMEDTVGEGGLFARPSSSAVPRRRRHAVAPRTVVLSGVNAANGRRLDELVPAWGAGTRSALVEQALRYEFNLT